MKKLDFPNHCIRALWLSAFSILFVTAYCGNKEDSLKQVVIRAPEKQDQSDALIALTKYYISGNQWDSAGKYLDIAVTISETINDREKSAECYYFRSILSSATGNYQAALDPVRKYISIAQTVNDQTRLGKGYYQLGNLYYTLGKTDSAIALIRQSLDINLELNDSTRLLANYNLLGNIFLAISAHDSAMVYYLKAAGIAEKSGQSKYLANIYCNIGKSLVGNYEFEDAGQYFELSENIARNNNDMQTLAIDLINLGGIYFTKEDFAKSLDYYNRAREIVKSLNNKMIRADLYNNYARLYVNQKMFNLAQANYDSALMIYREEKYPKGIVSAMMNKGWIYNATGEYNLANDYLTSSLEIASDMGFKEEKLYILYYLSDNYYHRGDYKTAFDRMKVYADLYDSIYSLEKTSVINDLKQKYEKGLYETRILNLEKETLTKSIQRNRAITYSFIILAISLYIFLVIRQKLMKSRMRDHERIRLLEEQEKIVAAGKLVEGQEEERKRIAKDLHDGLGVLLSAAKIHLGRAKDELQTDQPILDKAIGLVEEAASEARKISHNMMPGLLTRFGFFEAAEELIENINDTGRISAICEISGEPIRMAENTEIMLYRILQEMVNNTLKYAKATKIGLQVVIATPALSLEYSDDGIGFDIEQVMLSGQKSLGVKNIETRVGFLKGELKISSQPGHGVRYSIFVPDFNPIF